MIREGAANVNFRAAAAPNTSWVLAAGVPPPLTFLKCRYVPEAVFEIFRGRTFPQNSEPENP
jgi:hypothetical protein